MVVVVVDSVVVVVGTVVVVVMGAVVVVVVVGRVVVVVVGRVVVVRLPASVVDDAADVLATTTGSRVVELVLVVALVMTVPRTSGAGTSVLSAEPDHGKTPAVSATTTTSRPTTSFENQR